MSDDEIGRIVFMVDQLRNTFTKEISGLKDDVGDMKGDIGEIKGIIAAKRDAPHKPCEDHETRLRSLEQKYARTAGVVAAAGAGGGGLIFAIAKLLGIGN